MRRDACGLRQTIDNRWSRLGVFNKLFAEPAAGSDSPDRLMIDATHLRVDRTAACLFKRGSTPLYRAQSRRG